MALHDISSDPQTYWEIDPKKTTIAFVIGWSPLHRVRGRLHDAHGWVVTSGDDPTTAMIQIEIDAASIDTRLKVRDTHLRRDLFLSAERFPTISFRSMRVEAHEEGELRVFGDITIKGVTRPVALDAKVEQRDDESAQLAAHTVLDRRDFQIGPRTMGIMAGNRVDVEIALALRAR